MTVCYQGHPAPGSKRNSVHLLVLFTRILSRYTVICSLKKLWGKYALGLGILRIAVFTLFIPLAATYWGTGWLIGVRFLERIGEGSTFPALKLHKKPNLK
jgi:MFS family permease